MLIFAVLMDDSGLTFQGAGGAHTEVRSALPLALAAGVSSGLPPISRSEAHPPPHTPLVTTTVTLVHGDGATQVTVVNKSHHHVPIAVVTFSSSHFSSSQPYPPLLAAPLAMSSAVAAAAASMLGLPGSSLPPLSGSGLQHLFGGGSSKRRKRRRR